MVKLMMRPSPPVLGGYFPKQIRRVVPACLVLLLCILLLSSASSFGEFSVELSYHASTHTHQFPRKIWQTWKVDPLDFEERDLTTARTWVAKNPGHRYEVLTDQNDLHYVETHFGPFGLNRPDIVYTYRSLTAKILKADLLRYLVMYVEGGVYTDIDVEALKPVDRFIPDRYDQKQIDMVIGVEVDQPDFHNHTILGGKCKSFCQWTFMCKPRLRVMMKLINHILEWLNEVARAQGKPISEIELDFDEVISGTGPSAFTRAILEEMSIRSGRQVDWNCFHNLGESKLVEGILVLTVEAFAAGQGHSDSGNHNAKTALVKHHYHASGWPTNHPRYSHPVYGEVEQCNWETECVKQWDADKAAFDALSPEEQTKQIAMKEASGNPIGLEAPMEFPLPE
jgi:mannosyltransferase OCH1-like enzyme